MQILRNFGQCVIIVKTLCTVADIFVNSKHSMQLFFDNCFEAVAVLGNGEADEENRGWV